MENQQPDNQPAQPQQQGIDYRSYKRYAEEARKYKELSATIINIAQAHRLNMPELNPSLSSLKEALSAIIEVHTDERENLAEHIDLLKAQLAPRKVFLVLTGLTVLTFGIGIGFAIGIGCRLMSY